ncbi:MAG: M48 family metalloprotease [Bradyrhizobium sp.]|uniref:M48 family metalloprotease n=1 Tax=Bradyrhizobium sp. TaxID=376 RepID=UPI003D0AD20D
MFASLDALMVEMGQGARLGARSILALRGEDRLWDDLDQEVHALVIDGQRGSTEALDQRALRMIERTTAALERGPNSPARRAAFMRCVEDIARLRSSWLTLAAPDTVARHVSAVVVWHCAWHLLAADLTSAGLMGVLRDEPQRQPMAPPQPPRLREPSPLTTVARRARPEPAAPAPREIWRRRAETVGRLAKHVGTRLGVGLGIALRATGRGLRRAAECVAEARTKQAARQKEWHDQWALRVQEAEADRRRRRESFQRFDASPDRVGGLFGRGLRKSVFPTWLMLVGCSWVALVWGALLLAPFNGGIGSAVMVMGGVVAVPIWGTVFGFIGMGGARDTTLRQMNYQDLPESHPVADACQTYCAVLEIPMPRLGTIPVHNAFAMGLDERNATVAIGKPLLDTLTPTEVNAVLAHELGHVVSGDMRRMMLMRTFQNATVWFMLAQGAKQVLRWVLSWAAELAILAFSRKREFWADAIGAALAGKEAMIGALQKLEQAPVLGDDERRHARFMVRGVALSTHPSTADRIAALKDETYIRRLPRI